MQKVDQQDACCAPLASRMTTRSVSRSRSARRLVTSSPAVLLGTPLAPDVAAGNTPSIRGERNVSRAWTERGESVARAPAIPRYEYLSFLLGGTTQPYRRGTHISGALVRVRRATLSSLLPVRGDIPFPAYARRVPRGHVGRERHTHGARWRQAARKWRRARRARDATIWNTQEQTLFRAGDPAGGIARGPKGEQAGAGFPDAKL